MERKRSELSGRFDELLWGCLDNWLTILLCFHSFILLDWRIKVLSIFHFSTSGLSFSG